MTRLRNEFPNLVSYNRFVELIPSVIVPLNACLGTCTGITFIDSTTLAVCKNPPIYYIIRRLLDLPGVHSWIGAERSGWATALPSPTLRFAFAGSTAWWKVAPVGECTPCQGCIHSQGQKLGWATVLPSSTLYRFAFAGSIACERCPYW